MATTYIPRHTFTLDGPVTTDFVPSIVLVVRERDGEIRLVVVDGDHRAAREREETIENYGGIVLERIEGEKNLATGEASVWARQ